MARGIEGRDIFFEDDDRSYFLSLLSEGIQKTGYSCYAWVLMGNHYHLLLRINEQPLGNFMRRLNGKYARYYSKKHQRKGYLFQDRYKSIVTQDQGYIEKLVRYIHRNPLRSGVCRSMRELDRYSWCGHGVLLGNGHADFQDVVPVLRRFGKTTSAARRRYREFINKDGENDEGLFIDQIRRSNKGAQNRNDFGSWVIGDKEFVQRALQADDRLRFEKERMRKAGWTLDKIADCVSKELSISKESLFIRGSANDRSRARKVFCYLGVRKARFAQQEVAAYIGISAPSAAVAIIKGEETAKKMKLDNLIN
jgi:putative transposase